MESGQLKSPGFPNNYPNNKICYWTITVPFGFSVTLDFETFEVSDDASLCQYDYVEIRDGGDLTSKILGKFCGNTLPGSIRSTGNQLFVKFHSDHSNQYKGFSASLTNGKNFFILRSNLFLNRIACNHNFVMTKDRKREHFRSQSFRW